MIRIQKSPVFDSRFVPHRQIWYKDDDASYECIDRTNYASVVVRLQRFSTTDMERRKKGIQKAVEGAIKHPSLCDVKEVLIDEENCITVSISENARGINFQRFVDLCSTKPGYDGALQYILLTLLNLYQDLYAANLDLSSLPLSHVIISLKNNSAANIESIKVRRPYLCKLDRNRALKSPYNLFNGSYPAFVDLAAAAFYSFKKEDIFKYSSPSAAFSSLSDMQKLLFELLLAFTQPEFDAARDVIQNMYNLEAKKPESVALEQVVIAEDTVSNVVPGEEEYEVETAIEDDESDTETALEEEDEIKTAIGHEDIDEVRTAIGDNDDELETAIDDEEYETKTSLEDDETRTAVEEEEYDEVRTAIEDEDDEIHTAIAEEEDDMEVKTAIGEDEVDPPKPQLDTVINADVILDEPEIDDMFDARSLVSNESDFDVILSADTVVEEPQAIFVTKDYGFDGLTIKLFDNQCACCEFNDQFITFDAEMAEIGSSNSKDTMPTVDVLEQLVSNVRVMAALTNATIVPSKKYLVNFVEEK